VVDADAAQKAAALVVNSVGQHSLPKRPAIKQTQFDRAVDLVGDAIQAARNAKLGRTRDNKEQAKAAKSLAELLANQPRTANKRSRGNSLYFTSGVD
jgi:citrate lyase alpha subunit